MLIIFYQKKKFRDVFNKTWNAYEISTKVKKKIYFLKVIYEGKS